MEVDAALTYLDFVCERHRVYEARMRGDAQPWTTDPILASRKFTNVFRVLDPGSQFVFRFTEDDPSDRDLLMRLFLYRHTGRTEAWEWVHKTLGRWPVVEDLSRVEDCWWVYRGEGRPVFTGAYLVYPQSSTPGTDKVESIVGLTQRLFTGTMPDVFLVPGTQRDRFTALRSNKGVADFMSMQILTDWGYLRGGDEDSFVVPGPGARKGAAVIDPSRPAERVIDWAQGAVHSLPDCPQLSSGRRPSAMDIQNTMCEYSKYVRYLGKPLTGKAYVPAHAGPQPLPVLPQHW